MIVPTIGRPESLALLLRDLHASPVPIESVIVVADGVAQPIRGRLSDLVRDGISIIDLPTRQGAAAARNAAARTVDAGLLCFLDDDVRLSDSWADALRQALESEWECFTGPVTSTELGTLAVAREDRYLRRYAGLAAGQYVNFLAGGNSVISVPLFRAAGEFPLVRVGSDSAIISAIETVGAACRFAPRLVVSHTHDRGWRVALDSAYRSGWTSTHGVLAGEFRSLVCNRPKQPMRVRLINLVFLLAKSGGCLLSDLGRPAGSEA